MTPLDAIAKIETFTARPPREVPYLGPLRAGEAVNEKGYLVRRGNRTIYPDSDISVLVKVTGESGEIEWVARGYRGIKFAAAMSDEGIVQEMAALREAVGPDIDLMVDLHWKFGAAEAIRLIRRLEAFTPYFAEAPCQPEDVDGQAAVATAVGVPIALGEEWHTVHEVRRRIAVRTCAILQPEMGHTGITQFARIGLLAQVNFLPVIPHATISTGIFMVASLQAASTLQHLPYHEYQHSVFDANLVLTEGDMAAGDGAYTVPSGPGLGVWPSDKLLSILVAT